MKRSMNRRVSSDLSRLGIATKASFNKIADGLEKLISNKDISINFCNVPDGEFFDYKVTIGGILNYYGISKFAALYSAYVDILQYEYSSDLDIAIKNGTKVEGFPSLLTENLTLGKMTPTRDIANVEIVLELTVPYYDTEEDEFKFYFHDFNVSLDLNTGVLSPYYGEEDEVSINEFNKILRESSESKIVISKDIGLKKDKIISFNQSKVGPDDLLELRSELLDINESFMPVFISGISPKGEELELISYLEYSTGEVLMPYGLSYSGYSEYKTLHSCSLFVNSQKHKIQTHIKMNSPFSKISQHVLEKITKNIHPNTTEKFKNILIKRALKNKAYIRFKYDPIDGLLNDKEELSVKSIIYDFEKNTSSTLAKRELIKTVSDLYAGQNFLLVDAIIYKYRSLKLIEDKNFVESSSFWKYETAKDYPYKAEEHRIKNFFIWSKIIEEKGVFSTMESSLEFDEEKNYFNSPEGRRVQNIIPFYKLEDYPKEAVGSFLFIGVDFSIDSNEICLTKIGEYRIRNISEIVNSYLLNHTFSFEVKAVSGKIQIDFIIKNNRSQIPIGSTN